MLSLPLLMLRIAAANDANDSITPNHFAMLANRFYTTTNFHYGSDFGSAFQITCFLRGTQLSVEF